MWTDVVYTVNTEYDLENIDAVELNEGDTGFNLIQ